MAALAGLSAGIVNFYFRGKDALLLATLEHVDREFARRQAEAARLAGDDPVRLLDAMVEVEFDPEVCNPRWTAVWNAFWGEARAREDYMRVCGARERAHESQIVDLFSRIAEAGGHGQLHPEALGRAFYHLLSSLPENMLDGHEPFDFDDAKSTCRAFLTSVFPDEFSNFSDFTEPARSELVSEPDSRFQTLPTWVYHDPEFFELEMERIFRQSWLIVGHTSEAPEIGDYITLDVAHDRVFVIRRPRRRAARLRQCLQTTEPSRVVRGEIGHCSDSIVCPYHGWRYGFDGRLRGVPAEQSFRDLEKSQIALPELELEE